MPNETTSNSQVTGESHRLVRDLSKNQEIKEPATCNAPICCTCCHIFEFVDCPASELLILFTSPVFEDLCICLINCVSFPSRLSAFSTVYVRAFRLCLAHSSIICLCIGFVYWLFLLQDKSQENSAKQTMVRLQNQTLIKLINQQQHPIESATCPRAMANI